MSTSFNSKINSKMSATDYTDEKLIPQSHSDEDNSTPDEDNSIPNEEPVVTKKDLSKQQLLYVTKDYKTTFKMNHFEGEIIHRVMKEGADEKLLPLRMKEGRSRPRVAPTNEKLKKKQDSRFSEVRYTKDDFFPEPMTPSQLKTQKAQHKAKTDPTVKEKRKEYCSRQVWLSRDLNCTVPIEDPMFDLKDPATYPFKKGEQVRYRLDEFFDKPVPKSKLYILRKQANPSQCWVLEKYNEQNQYREAIELIGSANDTKIKELIATARKKIETDQNYKFYKLRCMSQKTYYAAKRNLDPEYRAAKNKRLQNNRKKLVKVDKNFLEIRTEDEKVTQATSVSRYTYQKALALMGGKIENYTRFLVRTGSPDVVVKVFTDEKEGLNAKAYLNQHPELKKSFKVVTRTVLKGYPTNIKGSHPTRKRKMESLQPLRDKLKESLEVTGEISDEVKAIFARETVSSSESGAISSSGALSSGVSSSGVSSSGVSSSGVSSSGVSSSGVSSSGVSSSGASSSGVSSSGASSSGVSSSGASSSSAAAPSTDMVSEQGFPKRRKIPRKGELDTTPIPIATKKIVLPKKAIALGEVTGKSLVWNNTAFDIKAVTELAVKEVGEVTASFYIESARRSYQSIHEKFNNAKTEGELDGRLYVKTYRVLPDMKALTFKTERDTYGPAFETYLAGVKAGAEKAFLKRAKEMGELRALRDVCLMPEPRTENDNELKKEADFYKINFQAYYLNYIKTFPHFKQRRETLLAAKKSRDAKDLDMITLKNNFELSDKAILTTSPYFKEEFEAIHGIPYIPGINDHQYKLIIDIESDIPGQFGLYAGQRITFPFIIRRPDGSSPPKELKKLILIEYTGQISTAKDYIPALNSEDYRMEFELNGIPTQIDAALSGNAARFANHAAEAMPQDDKDEMLSKANTFYLELEGRTFIAGVPGRIIKPGQRIGVTYKIPPTNALTLSTQSGLKRKFAGVSVAHPSGAGYFSQSKKVGSKETASSHQPVMRRG